MQILCAYSVPACLLSLRLSSRTMNVKIQDSGASDLLKFAQPSMTFLEFWWLTDFVMTDQFQLTQMLQHDRWNHSYQCKNAQESVLERSASTATYFRTWSQWQVVQMRESVTQVWQGLVSDTWELCSWLSTLYIPHELIRCRAYMCNMCFALQCHEGHPIKTSNQFTNSSHAPLHTSRITCFPR